MRRHHRRILVAVVLASLAACKARSSHQIVEKKRSAKPLALVLRDAANEAAEDELRPYLMFSAPWCQPCRVFKSHAGEPPLADALRGTYILVLDYDEWEKEAESLGVDGIPIWIALGTGGALTNRRLDSSEWTYAKPSVIAGALQAFLQK